MLLAIPAIIVLLFYIPASSQDQNKLNKIEESLKTDIPRVLCLSEKIATGGQPTEQAFGKLAAEGFRSVLNLRTASEDIDLEKQRDLAERSGLKYINIPIVTNAPEEKRINEFISAVKDKSNYPMLIHCGSANRVGALWMIYRVLEDGLTEDKALEEATKIGLTNSSLKTFAQNYISQNKQKVLEKK
jgi:uncharacterized protein (TIGR01244 family)